MIGPENQARDRLISIVHAKKRYLNERHTQERNSRSRRLMVNIDFWHRASGNQRELLIGE